MLVPIHVLGMLVLSPRRRHRTDRRLQKVRGLQDSDDPIFLSSSVVLSLAFFSVPSPDYQLGDEGVLDECEVVI
jgi:hypothetical protein